MASANGEKVAWCSVMPQSIDRESAAILTDFMLNRAEEPLLHGIVLFFFFFFILGSAHKSTFGLLFFIHFAQFTFPLALLQHEHKRFDQAWGEQ